MSDEGGKERRGLVAAMAEVGAVAKDKTNKHSKYSYQSEEAIKQAVQAALIATSTVPDSITMEILSDDWRDGKQGQQNIIKVRVSLVFDGRPYQGLGAGIDYGDKALMKAQTAAIREAWKTALCIPTSSLDPENDSQEGEPVNAGNPSEPVKNESRGNFADEEVTPESKVFWGRDKGKRLLDLDTKGLTWIAENFSKEAWKAAARQTLKQKAGSDPDDYSPPPFGQDDIPF
jgi:hypothetical protein